MSSFSSAESNQSSMRFSDQEKNLPLEESDKTKLEWSFGIIGGSYSEGNDRIVGTKTSLNLRAHYLISPIIYLDAGASLRWFSNSAQFDLSEDYSASFLGANELSFNFVPVDFFTLSFGNISQRFINSDLLISSRGFPGLKQKINWKSEKSDIGFIAQQTIPTSTSFNLDRTEKEKLPWFYTQTLYGEYELNSFLEADFVDNINLRLAGTYFQFKDLPAVTAEEGQLLGHFTIGSGPTAKFKYNFEGYLVDPSICFCADSKSKGSQTGITLGGKWLENLSAKTNNRAQSLYINFASLWQSSQLRFEFGFENYFKDAEVAPAIYGSQRKGSNNREGNIYSFRLDSLKYKVGFVADYYDIGLIERSGTVQDERRALYIGLETAYVEF